MRSFFRFVLVVLMSSLVSGPIVASAEEHVAPQPDSRTYTKTYPIRAVATVGMIADIVQNIAGPHATVETIIGHGGDPHLYKASPNDVRRLVSADIIFYNGLFLEGKMAEILESYNRSKPSIALGDWLDPLRPTYMDGRATLVKGHCSSERGSPTVRPNTRRRLQSK